MHGFIIWHPAPFDGNTDLNNSTAQTMHNTFDLLLKNESQSGGLVYEFLFTQYIKDIHYASWYKYPKPWRIKTK